MQLTALAEPTPGRAWAADPAHFLGKKSHTDLPLPAPARTARPNPLASRPRSLVAPARAARPGPPPTAR
jgi:hypothetical protein